jgi:hypothetical protein
MRRLAKVLCFLFLSFTLGAHASVTPELRQEQWAQRLKDFADGLSGLANPQGVACREYAVGESRRLFSRHLATKLEDKKYRIQIAVEFRAAPQVATDQAGFMREKVKACYKTAGALKAADGNELSFELLENASTSPLKVPPYTINVYIGGIRENSGNYSLEMDCPTILHETLHLVGLTDEYKEPLENMSCRSLGDSIMADQSQVHIEGLNTESDQYYRDQANTIFQTVESVQCQDRITQDIYQYSFVKSMNAYYLWHFKGAGSQSGKMLEAQPGIYVREDDLQPNSKLVVNEHTRYLMHLPEDGTWSCRLERTSAQAKRQTGKEILNLRFANYPLRPAHFRKIFFPRCLAKNQVYDYCTQETYLVPPTGHQCLKEKYPACNNGQWLM